MGGIREGALHDVFAQEITSRTGITYYHLFPGIVKTNVVKANNVGFLMSWMITMAMALVGTTPDNYAVVPTWVALTRPSYVTVDNYGKESPLKPFPKREDVRNKVMNWMINATGIEVDNRAT